MRVLFPFVGETIGGSHHSAALLMRALPPHGIEPVAFVHRAGPLRDFLLAQGIDVLKPEPLPLWEQDGGPIRSLLHLACITPIIWRCLRRLGVQAVHTNDGRMSNTWAPAARLAGKPLIVHQRTRLAPSRLSNLALGLAQAVIAISDYTRDSLPPSLRGKARVITNPFAADTPDRTAARAAVTAELGLPPTSPLLAFVGTLQRQKRPLQALAALARLHARGLRPILLIAGRTEGAEADAVRGAIASGAMGETVRLLGFRHDVATIIAASDAVLAPAVNEGHGRALIEAMLAGTPVVAADSGGHREIIADGVTGLLVPPDDADALADALASLLSQPSRADALAKAAMADALARYSVDAHARAVAALYRELPRP